MSDRIIYWAGNVLMVVEAAAVIFLITEWRKAKRRDKDE